MKVIVYADETGTHDHTGMMLGASVAGISGFLAWEDEWQTLCNEWRAVLNQYKVAAFHFSEFANKKYAYSNPSWQYYGWTDQKRHEFLLSLAKIAGSRTQFGLSAFFNVRDYNRVIPEWFRKNSAHPYDLCIKLFFKAIIDHLETRWLPSVSTKVEFIFDQNTDMDWEQSVRMMHSGAGRWFDPRKRIGQVSFADMRNRIPLQAADLLTYRMRQVNEKLLAKPTIVEKSSLDHALEQKPKSLILAYYNDRSLAHLASSLEKMRPDIEAAYRERKIRHGLPADWTP